VNLLSITREGGQFRFHEVNGTDSSDRSLLFRIPVLIRSNGASEFNAHSQPCVQVHIKH